MGLCALSDFQIQTNNSLHLYQTRCDLALGNPHLQPHPTNYAYRKGTQYLVSCGGPVRALTDLMSINFAST